VKITSNTVHLHTLNLDESRLTLLECWKLLSEAEQVRALRFRIETVKRRWIVAHAGLRSILSKYCGCTPAELEFERGAFGKPALAGPAAQVGITFNLSHSGMAAVVAVGMDTALGVDVELKKEIPDWPAVAGRFFSRDENAALQAAQESLRCDVFFRCWTRKEAVVKATGEGIGARLEDFDVSLSPAAGIPVIADRSKEQKYICWRLHSFEPWPGYIGALALPDRNSIAFVDCGEWLFEHR
jgi:4'-phosphopantetheinyl transferase